MTSRAAAGWALATLFAINAVNFLDRQVPGAVGESVRKEWSLSDRALGGLGTAFILLYAAVGLPLGRLADRFSRKKLLAAGVFVWSVLTAASGLAGSYWQLFALRLGVGVGEAVCAPAATSLIGDLFPASKRGRALSVFMMGLPVGIALSHLVGGHLAKVLDWRWAFFIAGLPGILCAALVLTVREPARGAADASGGASREPAAGANGPDPLRLLLSIPTLWWLILSGALHNFVMYAVGLFLGPLLMRRHGLDVGEAGLAMTAVYGLSGIPGLLIGGAISDALARRRASGRLLLGAAATLAWCPLVVLALRRPAGEALGFSLWMGSACGLFYVYYSSVYSTLHDVVEPRLRGTAMALYFLAMYFLGASLGPLGVGALSDHFTRAAASAAGADIASPGALEAFRADGLHAAMGVIPVLGLVLAVVLLAGSRTVARDAEWMRRRSAGG